MIETSPALFSSNFSNSVRRLLFGQRRATGVAPVVVLALGFAQIVHADDPPPCSMTPSALFGDFELPYMDLGAVWIRTDGMVLIDAGHGHGTAFFSNAAGMKLVENEGKVTFKSDVGTGGLIYSFVAASSNGCANCSAAYHIAGDSDLQYDSDTCRLTVTVDGAAQDFTAVFDFTQAQSVTEAPPTLDVCLEGSCFSTDGHCCHIHCLRGDQCQTCDGHRECTCHCDDHDRPRCSPCREPHASNAAIPAEIQP